MNTAKIAKELCFVADLIGLINNNFEDIHEESRNDLMIIAAERVYSIHKDMLKIEVSK